MHWRIVADPCHPISRVSRVVAVRSDHDTQRMPRFSANLTFLFTESPFLDRFGEAAHAGFRAVEFAFPYEYQVKEVEARIVPHKLEVVLFNAPPGDYGGGRSRRRVHPGPRARVPGGHRAGAALRARRCIARGCM